MSDLILPSRSGGDMDAIAEMMHRIESEYPNKKQKNGKIPGSKIEDVKHAKYQTWMLLTSQIMGPVDLMAIGIDQFKKGTWGGFVSAKDKRFLVNYFIQQLQKVKRTLPSE